jgi:hypothetical protein
MIELDYEARDYMPNKQSHLKNGMTTNRIEKLSEKPISELLLERGRLIRSSRWVLPLDQGNEMGPIDCNLPAACLE